MWNKEVEAAKIIAKESQRHNLFVKHKDGRVPTAYIGIGYQKESVMQGDFFQWAINSYPELSGYLFHIPNEGDTGGEAGAIKGGIRFAMGVVAGVPDFCFIRDDCSHQWIELKLPGERLSPAQEKLHKNWGKRGVWIPIVSTFIMWRALIESFISRF